MTRWPVKSAIVLSIFLLLATGNVAQDRGTIAGTVVDQSGAPVVKASVNAERFDPRPTGALVRFVETDANGHFLIDRLVWGKYKVFAKKEDAGYPDMGWSFYSDDVFPTATIAPTTPAAELRITLGPKAARLEGSVTNAVTGAPINCGFKLTRAASPDKWLSTSMPPDFQVLVPPSVDTLLEVSAPGFKAWSFPGPLRLQSGSAMHLDIALEPSHDPNLHPSKFLIPEGYMGWLLLEYGVKDVPPIATEDGLKVFKFPPSGTLSTSSPGPERGAEDEYFFYSQNGSLREIQADYRNGKGMIWGEYEGSKGGVMTQFGFFVGTEEQYKKYQSRQTRPGSIANPKKTD